MNSEPSPTRAKEDAMAKILPLEDIAGFEEEEDDDDDLVNARKRVRKQASVPV
jgi:hypothetical protein